MRAFFRITQTFPIMLRSDEFVGQFPSNGKYNFKSRTDALWQVVLFCWYNELLFSGSSKYSKIWPSYSGSWYSFSVLLSNCFLKDLYLWFKFFFIGEKIITDLGNLPHSLQSKLRLIWKYNISRNSITLKFFSKIISSEFEAQCDSVLFLEATNEN